MGLHQFFVSVSLIFMVFMTACVSDREPATGGADHTPLHINLLLTGAGSSRADIAEGNEQTAASQSPLISDALVLLFEPDENGHLSADSKLVSLKKAEHPVLISENHYSFDFQCNIDRGNVLPNLVAVILANGCGYYDLIEGKRTLTYHEISELVTAEYGDRETQLSVSSDREYFSFWGIASRPIDTSLLTQTLKVEMIRDLAKTSVILDAELTEIIAHKLIGIMIYNRFDTMAYLPEVGTDNQPVLPTIPEYSTKTVMPGISGAVKDGTTASILHPEQEILMGNAADALSDNRFIRPALIVGVDWRSSGKIYYYRVDYKEDDQLINVKRNHHYLVTIKDIKGPGAETPEEAYQIISTSVEAVVTPWTDMENDVEFDGDDWIAMERTVYLGSQKGSETTLGFFSSVPAEVWKMAWGGIDAEWDTLTFSEESVLISEDGAFGARKGENLTLMAMEALPEGMEQRTRQLYINVTGRLRVVVNVIQSATTSSEGMTAWDDQTIFDEI